MISLKGQKLFHSGYELRDKDRHDILILESIIKHSLWRKRMSIKQAISSDLETIKNISTVTISSIYPHYYPKGAVEFFLEHHNKDNILIDIENSRCFLCFDTLQNAIGTVTIKDNEICRLFVLPSCQRMGYGKELLDFAEKIIFSRYSKVILDASLPAKKIYLKRGFKDTNFHIICTKNNDFLCYDVMEKQL